MSRRDKIILAFLFVITFALMSWAVYTYFTALYTGGNDFYSRWAGAVALLVDGRNPYSLEVTREIQLVKGIDPALEGKGSFAYPLHVIFLFLPLVYTSYAWALAIWMVFLVWLTIAIVVALLKFFNWKTIFWVMALLILATLLMYPVTRSILLGQFTLHVAFFLILMLLFLQNGRDGWAGVALAMTPVKPQMVVLIGPWLVIWAIAQGRWRFVGGLVGGGLFSLVISLPLFPSWPLAFIEDIQRYAPVAGGKNPIVVFGDALVPGAGQFVRWGFTLSIVALMIWKCWRGVRSDGEPFLRATYWVITVTLLVLFQTGTTNQVLLLIPLYDWMLRLSKIRLGGWWVAGVLTLLIVLPWLLFANTVHGDTESSVMFLPLPLLSLFVLLWLEWREWRRGEPLSTITTVHPPS